MTLSAPQSKPTGSSAGGPASMALALGPATMLPDGSAFAVGSYPLPKDHWLYAEREYEPGSDEPKELPKPILTHAQRDSVVAAVRYAVRGATDCGKEKDFDPDALVQNAVYALCGPFTGKREAVAPDDSCVICPGCAHQFRAIPTQVQRLMLEAGFDPPFVTPPANPLKAPSDQDLHGCAGVSYTNGMTMIVGAADIRRFAECVLKHWGSQS